MTHKGVRSLLTLGSLAVLGIGIAAHCRTALPTTGSFVSASHATEVVPYSTPIADDNLEPSPIPNPRDAAAPSKLESYPDVTTPPAGIPTAIDQQKASFDLSQVERIKLRVWGDSELSGDYTIDPDHSMSLPRIGRFDVTGMSLAKFEATLGQKLREVTRDETTVSAGIEKFRPYFISGRVVRAGAIEWRPGLKVIGAVTLAGGIARGTEVNASKQNLTQLVFALAQLARLKAEKDAVGAVEITQRIALLVNAAPASSQEVLASLMKRQNAMLSEQKVLLQDKLTALQRERESAQRELEAAEAQHKAVASQLQVSRSLFADYDGLRDRNIVTKNRYLTQRSDLLTIEVRVAESDTLVARARARLASVEQQIADLPRERSIQLNERMEILEREVAQREIAMSERVESVFEGSALDIEYRIARDDGAGMRTLTASVFTDVLPGDVLIVSEKTAASVALTHPSKDIGSIAAQEGSHKTAPPKAFHESASRPLLSTP